MISTIPFSPYLRNLFEPLLYSKGKPLRQHWKQLETTQYLPEDLLRQKQWLGVKNLLRFVWENNRFYRSRLQTAGITPDDIRSPEDMNLIPILTKEDIRHNTSLMISSGYQIANLLNFKTGGSTGKALDVYITEKCSYLRNALSRRHDQWSGWHFGEPIAAVWGNPYLPVGMKERLKHWLLTPYIYLDTMSISEKSVRKFAAEWRRACPTLLFGHAHSLYILAQCVRNLEITSIHPRGILSTSMMLMPHERKTIEEVFGVKVTDRYGCEEVSLIASECEKHDGLHLNIEHLFIEFVKDDGSYARPGQPGRIIVTDLLNLAMPFFRYQVEDVGVPSDRKCPCGRGLPLMEHVTGRVADFLIKRDGSRVAGISLIENTLTKIPGIEQMQIVQESLDLIMLNLVVNSLFTKAREEELVRYFKDLFLQGADIKLKYTDSIRSGPGGKYRFSVCNVAH